MKKAILALSLGTLAFASCSKNTDDDKKTETPVTEQQVLDNFADGVAYPQYKMLATKAEKLYEAIARLNVDATEAHLDGAKSAWLDMRSTWEQCEGFLFGPVEDNEYDPFMDTWPTDYVQMDSLLSSSNSLSPTEIKNVELSLRGFHPIEYILFGDHGSRQASAITARQKTYMVSLATDLRENCQALSDSWAPEAGNYSKVVKTAGTGSTKYATRQEVFIAIADGLIGICEEVGEGKMEDPFASQDAGTVESPYSGNSITDFKNNITGLENVYLGRFNGTTGKSLSDLVRANNLNLDARLREQMTAAINSFNNITLPYEQAIFTQGQQIQQTQAALATLKTTLESELRPYIQQYIRD